MTDIFVLDSNNELLKKLDAPELIHLITNNKYKVPKTDHKKNINKFVKTQINNKTYAKIQKKNVLLMSDDETVNLAITVFQDIIESLTDEFGDKVRSILYDVGTRSGRRSAEKRLREAKGKKKKSIELLFKLKHEQNWADIKLLEFDSERNTGKISVKNCFEAHLSDNSCKCDFTSGFLSGFLSTVLNGNIKIPNLTDNKCTGSCEHIFWMS